MRKLRLAITAVWMLCLSAMTFAQMPDKDVVRGYQLDETTSIFLTQEKDTVAYYKFYIKNTFSRDVCITLESDVDKAVARLKEIRKACNLDHNFTYRDAKQTLVFYYKGNDIYQLWCDTHNGKFDRRLLETAIDWLNSQKFAANNKNSKWTQK